MMWGFGYGGEWWMAVIDVLIPLLVIAGIVLLVFVLRQSGSPSPPARSDAQHVLEERFARGEIDEDEFKRRSTTLRSQSGHA